MTTPQLPNPNSNSGPGSQDSFDVDAPWFFRTIENVVNAQRPLVIGHLREMRRKHPRATPQQMTKMLETRYLAAVSVSGAAVGATAVVPGIGTAAAIGLTAAETVGFLEASALFALAVSEVHGIPLRDPERAKALVMSLMLGSAGSTVVKRLASQSVGGAAAGTAFWGQLITSTLPQGVVGQIAGQLRKVFATRLVTAGGKGAIGRAIPFGIGAVIGGAGNHILGRQIVQSARDAFGPAPKYFTTTLDPQPKVSLAAKLSPKRRREDKARRSLETLSEQSPGVSLDELMPAPDTSGGSAQPQAPGEWDEHKRPGNSA
ncbi:hypothetical protein [Humidisolicoccus flavus]|uniref:hypothetical protein n=1 Tax=Humidisolicoccus flavus TaxID=3111414 RepID=UPI003253AB4F